MTGVRDEQEKFLATKKLTIDVIDFPNIINGTAPGWTELSKAEDLSVKAIMVLKTYDAGVRRKMSAEPPQLAV